MKGATLSTGIQLFNIIFSPPILYNKRNNEVLVYFSDSRRVKLSSGVRRLILSRFLATKSSIITDTAYLSAVQ